MNKENTNYSTPISFGIDSPSSTTSSPINKESVSDILSMIENIKSSQKGNTTPKRYNSFKKTKSVSSPLANLSFMSPMLKDCTNTSSNTSCISDDLENFATEEMKKIQDAQSEKLKKYEEEISTLSTNFTNIVNDRTQLLDKINVMEVQLEENIHELDGTKNELVSCQTRLVELQTREKTLFAKVSTMEKQLDSFTQLSISQSDLLNQTKQQLEVVTKEFETKYHHLEHDASQLKSVALDLENDVLHLNQEVDLKNSEISHLKHQLSHQKRQNELLKESMDLSIKHIHKEKETLESHLMNQIQVLTNENKELTHLVSYSNSKSNIVQGEFEKNTKNIESQLGLLRRSYLEKTLTIQLLNKQLNDVDLEKEHLKKDVKKIKQLTNERNLILKKYTQLSQESAILNKMYQEKVEYIEQFEKEYTLELEERSIMDQQTAEFKEYNQISKELIETTLKRIDQLSLKRNHDKTKTFTQRVEMTNNSLEALRLELINNNKNESVKEILQLLISNIDSMINYNVVQNDLFVRIQEKDTMFHDLMKRFGLKK